MTTHWTFETSKTATPASPAAMEGLAATLIPGRSAPMRAFRQLLCAVAPSDAPVLVLGPSGSGKELAAEAVHRLSGRSGAFVAVNCAAIPADLLEGELFGHERGAFTGADKARVGLIEQAAGGTLFLDEIGDMPLSLQAKLLRVLETRSVRRLGSGATVTVDFRLVAATHRNLPEVAQAGGFRLDLYYRLAVFPLQMPSLAERTADLADIILRILDERRAASPGLALPEFEPSALRALAAHDWPGNVRELKTVVLRACLLFPGRKVGAREVADNLLSFSAPAVTTPDDQGAWPAAPVAGDDPVSATDRFRTALDKSGGMDLRCYLRDIEVALIEAALDSADQCVSRAADVLRLRRTTLIEKMRKYGIQRGE